MSEKERIDLHNSFKKFHYVDLVIIDNDNRVIGGHQRLHEMEKNSQFGSNAIIDVRVPSRKLTEKEFEELAIRLNKNHGRWDNELLKNFFNSDVRRWLKFTGKQAIKISLNNNTHVNAKKEKNNDKKQGTVAV